MLATLTAAATGLDSIAVAGHVFGRYEVTASEASSVRRALRQPAGQGLVIDLGREYRDGRRQ